MSADASPAWYEIRVQGVLDSRCAAWFEDLQLASDDRRGETVPTAWSPTRQPSTACWPGSAAWALTLLLVRRAGPG